MKDGPEGEETASHFKVITNLDLDQDGEPISSCVIDAINKGANMPTKHPHKLTGAAKIGLDQLRNCCAKYVTPIPPSDHVPNGAQGVLIELWKKYLIAVGVLNPDGNPREQFRRV
jgi:hypothetical protein